MFSVVDVSHVCLSHIMKKYAFDYISGNILTLAWLCSLSDLLQ